MSCKQCLRYRRHMTYHTEYRSQGRGSGCGRGAWVQGCAGAARVRASFPEPGPARVVFRPGPVARRARARATEGDDD